MVKVVDFKPLYFTREEAIVLAYETSGVLLRMPFLPEIMHWRTSEVILNQ
jgi:hypothetical protein